MQYMFSAEFLKILPPATNFGEAWENLCLNLLRLHYKDNTIMRLAPPDRGVDIFQKNTSAAYQCKSSERGVFGTIEPVDCVVSLHRAMECKTELGWEKYFIALNAPLSGVGCSKILTAAAALGATQETIQFLPHTYWEALCDEYKSQISNLFDYRIFVTESEVIDLMRKARYYDRVLQEAEQKIKENPIQISVSNNRTPVELRIPFSGDLTIEQLLDVVKSKFGISLDWANFPDLGTSCGPSLSLTIDKSAQPFATKLSSLTAAQLEKLNFWIKLMWSDSLQEDRKNYDGTVQFFAFDHSLWPGVRPASQRERRSMTLKRMESIVQSKIWRSITKK